MTAFGDLVLRNPLCRREGLRMQRFQVWRQWILAAGLFVACHALVAVIRHDLPRESMRPEYLFESQFLLLLIGAPVIATVALLQLPRGSTLRSGIDELRLTALTPGQIAVGHIVGAWHVIFRFFILWAVAFLLLLCTPEPWVVIWRATQSPLSLFGYALAFLMWALQAPLLVIIGWERVVVNRGVGWAIVFVALSSLFAALPVVGLLNPLFPWSLHRVASLCTVSGSLIVLALALTSLRSVSTDLNRLIEGPGMFRHLVWENPLLPRPSILLAWWVRMFAVWLVAALLMALTLVSHFPFPSFRLSLVFGPSSYLSLSLWVCGFSLVAPVLALIGPRPRPAVLDEASPGQTLVAGAVSMLRAMTLWNLAWLILPLMGNRLAPFVGGRSIPWRVLPGLIREAELFSPILILLMLFFLCLPPLMTLLAWAGWSATRRRLGGCIVMLLGVTLALFALPFLWMTVYNRWLVSSSDVLHLFFVTVPALAALTILSLLLAHIRMCRRPS